MKLLVDAGNTRIKYAFLDDGDFSPIYIATVLGVEQQLTESMKGPVKQCVIASVKDSAALKCVINWCNKQSISVLQLNSPATFSGLTSSYTQPETLGIDRWLAMLGAKTLYPEQAVMIIDTGTATTVDCIDQHGQHLGGWIIPGLALQMSTLFDTAEQVKGEPSTVNEIAFGNTTSMAVSQGALNATLGVIEQAIKVAKQKDLLPRIILTGGNADYISPFVEYQHCVQPALIFHGMSQYC